MRIKQILREKGITAKELAARLGMTETGLSISIGEKGNPPLKRLQQIADALGVEVSELFTPKDGSVFRCPYCGKPIHITKDE